MDGRRAVLGPADMDLPMGEVDRIPAQRDQLNRAQAMPVGEQHHGGVAMPVSVVARRLDHLLNLGPGQVFARPGVGIRPSSGRLNCPINGCWGDQRQVCFCHGMLLSSRCSIP